MRARSLTSWAPVVALGAGVAGCLAVGLLTATPETTLAQSFAARVEHARDRIAADGAIVPVAASDSAWLGSVADALQPLSGAALAVGDRMTLSSASGRTRTFEVVEVAGLKPQASGAGGAGSHLLLVTARDVAAPAGGAELGTHPSATIRFVIEADSAAPGLRIEAPRDL